MTKIGKIFPGVAMVGILLGGAACSVSEGEAPETEPAPESTPSASALDPLDLCSLLKPAEIKERGLDSPGRPSDGDEEESSCDFIGDPFSVRLYKNQKYTVESYGKTDKWASYKPTTVNGRPAAQAISDSAKNSRLCFTLFDAGGGVVMASAQEFKDGGLDECAESTKVAEIIEPRVPR